jgi:hypothetical protein
MECAKQGICKEIADACRVDANCAAFESCSEDCRSQNLDDIADFITCRTNCSSQWPDAVDKYLTVLDCVLCTGCMISCETIAPQGNCAEWDTSGPDTDTENELSPPWDPINPNDSTGLPEIGTDGQYGKVMRYWDCCKPACAWPQNTGGKNPITCCTQSDSVHSDSWEGASSCNGGDVYACWNNAPWAVNSKLAYGFVKASAEAESFTCGDCLQFELVGVEDGKTMVVQVSDIGTDVAATSFAIMIPGGGVGMYDGCSEQWGVSRDQLGSQFGGFHTTCLAQSGTVRDAIECTNDKCNTIFGAMPDLKAGCLWFTNWFRAAGNPLVKYKKIDCAAALTDVSGMK